MILIANPPLHRSPHPRHPTTSIRLLARCLGGRRFRLHIRIGVLLNESQRTKAVLRHYSAGVVGLLLAG